MGVVKIARITHAFLAISHNTEGVSHSFATLLVIVRMPTTPPYSIVEYGAEQGLAGGGVAAPKERSGWGEDLAAASRSASQKGRRI